MFYQFSRFRLFSFGTEGAVQRMAMMSQGQSVKWKTWKKSQAIFDFSRPILVIFDKFSCHFETFFRGISRLPAHAFLRESTDGENIWQTIKNQTGEWERNVTNSLLLIDVLMFLSVYARKKQRKSQIMKLHSHVKRSLSAPSHHHSFPSVSRSSMLAKTQQKFSFVNFCATWITAMQKKRRGKLSSCYGHRVISRVCVCVSVLASLPHPSTNMALQFETINHLFMIINNLLLNFINSASVDKWTRNRRTANGIRQSSRSVSLVLRLCVCWKTITSY